MKVIIIGGNAAGLSAASAIRKNHKDWEILVYEKAKFVSYGSCGIPYYISQKVKSIDSLMTLTVDSLKKKRNIPVFLYHEVTYVNFKEKKIRIKKIQESFEFEEKYDYLMIATGANSNIRKIKHSEEEMNHPHLFKIHNLSDASRLYKFLLSNTINNVVVIGSGYIGLEMLEAYEAHGIPNITIIGPRLNFYSESQKYIHEELTKHKINIIYKRAKAIKKLSENKLKVILDDDSEIETDLVQISIGVLPATEIFKNTDLAMMSNGAIIINEYCCTNIPNVYAAGDCATSYHNLMQKNVYIPLAPTANKQGRIAGTHIAEKSSVPFPGIFGTAIFKVFDLYCASTGINDEEAYKLGYDVDSILIENKEIAHYYPNAEKMSVLLRFDKKSHLILGAEITAPSPMGAKKIDVLSTALSGKMTIEDLQKLDLSYAPPFAPVWDPILIAANIAQKKINN